MSNMIDFADPYKRCTWCNGWVDGVLHTAGPSTLVPCGHQAEYRDVCPSWSPVDGCRCPAGEHDGRPRPEVDDGKTY